MSGELIAEAAESVPEPGEGIESAEPGIIMGVGEGVEDGALIG